MDRPNTTGEISTAAPDFEELSRNMARFMEAAGQAAAAYLKPLEKQPAKTGVPEEVGELVKTLGHVAESWLVDPQRTIEAQTRLGTRFFELWATTLKRVQGEPVEPVAQPEPKDSRFADPEWSQNPV